MYAQTADLLKELAKNPIAELVIGFALIEKLQERGVLGNAQGNIMEAAIAGIIIAQQIAPLVPALVEGGKGIAGATGALGTLLALPGPP